MILDEAIPMLLRAARRPTFVTINVTDFWQRIPPETQCCIVCVAVPHTRALEASGLVRRLFALDDFRTQHLRLGKMVRVSQRQVQYYTTTERTIQRLDWPQWVGAAARLGLQLVLTPCHPYPRSDESMQMLGRCRFLNGSRTWASTRGMDIRWSTSQAQA